LSVHVSTFEAAGQIGRDLRHQAVTPCLLGGPRFA
jgi:hypothetical protein